MKQRGWHWFWTYRGKDGSWYGVLREMLSLGSYGQGFNEVLQRHGMYTCTQFYDFVRLQCTALTKDLIVIMNEAYVIEMGIMVVLRRDQVPSRPHIHM